MARATWATNLLSVVVRELQAPPLSTFGPLANLLNPIVVLLMYNLTYYQSMIKTVAGMPNKQYAKVQNAAR